MIAYFIHLHSQIYNPVSRPARWQNFMLLSWQAFLSIKDCVFLNVVSMWSCVLIKLFNNNEL